MIDPKVLALAISRTSLLSDITKKGENYVCRDKEFQVLTQNEAVQAAYAELDRQIDEALQPVSPELQRYFDREVYISDVLERDGLGGFLKKTHTEVDTVELKINLPLVLYLDAWGNTEPSILEKKEMLEQLFDTLNGETYLIFETGSHGKE